MSSILDELKEAKNELVGMIEGLQSITLLRDRIKSDFKLEELKTSLQTLPNKIGCCQQDQATLKGEIDYIDSEMKSMETELVYVINMDTNGKDKPKFSNADSRKAELNRRLIGDAGYQKYKQKKCELEAKNLNYEIEIDRLRKQFQAILAIKDLVCAELNLYK